MERDKNQKECSRGIEFRDCGLRDRSSGLYSKDQ